MVRTKRPASLFQCDSLPRPALALHQTLLLRARQTCLCPCLPPPPPPPILSPFLFISQTRFSAHSPLPLLLLLCSSRRRHRRQHSFNSRPSRSSAAAPCSCFGPPSRPILVNLILVIPLASFTASSLPSAVSPQSLATPFAPLRCPKSTGPPHSAYCSFPVLLYTYTRFPPLLAALSSASLALSLLPPPSPQET